MQPLSALWFGLAVNMMVLDQTSHTSENESLMFLFLLDVQAHIELFANMLTWGKTVTVLQAERWIMFFASIVYGHNPPTQMIFLFCLSICYISIRLKVSLTALPYISLNKNPFDAVVCFKSSKTMEAGEEGKRNSS